MTSTLLDAKGETIGAIPAPVELILPSVAKPDAIFLYDRQVPPEWQRALEQVCPRYDGVSWFKIAWEPGEEFDPKMWVQRWVIWQMRTQTETEKLILRDYPGVTGFRDEHPRLNAHWNRKLGCYTKPDGRMAKTDKLTYELYQQTGCYGVRFHVIQGEHGGHRYNLSHVEKQILTLGSNGKMRDVPMMADLPYAPFDSRVLVHFAKIEQAALARKVYKYAAQRLDQLDRDERDEMEYARCLMFDYLGKQFGELYDEFKPHYQEQLRKIPRVHGQKAEHTDGDELKDRFVKDY